MPTILKVRTTHVTGCITDIGSTAGRAAILLLRRFCHREGSGGTDQGWRWVTVGFWSTSMRENKPLRLNPKDIFVDKMVRFRVWGIFAGVH